MLNEKHALINLVKKIIKCFFYLGKILNYCILPDVMLEHRRSFSIRKYCKVESVILKIMKDSCVVIMKLFYLQLFASQLYTFLVMEIQMRQLDRKSN